MSLRLDWVDYKAALYACEHWHYSKTIPKGAGNYIGVWENGTFIGVVIYGFSISPSVGMTYGLSQFEICELRRIALNQHETPVSRIISISMGMLRKKNPGTKMIVSYADTMQDHHGGIYQVSNWVYVGTSAAMTQYCIDGKWRNDIHAYKKEMRDISTGKRKIPAKHKYLYPLTDDMRRKIEPLRKPYPKKSALVVHPVRTPGDQPGEGGSIPTPTHDMNINEKLTGQKRQKVSA